MKHRLTNIDESTRLADCSICGQVKIKIRNSKAKTLPAKWRCKTVYKRWDKSNKFPYRKYKKDTCEHCGFIPVHKVQLDVDHIDGNHKNNNPTNLQTLCANCHRLKTYLNEDWLPS